MKKIIMLLAISALLASCTGKDSDDTKMVEETDTVVVETPTETEDVLTEDEINAAIEDLFNDTAK